MPLLKHARKKLRQDKKRTVANKKVKTTYKSMLKTAKENPTAESISAAVSSVDKAVKNHIIHANKAARIKSSLSKISPEGAAAPKKERKAAPAKTTVKKAPAKDDPLTPDPDAPSEAAVMKRELIEMGVPKEVIIEEDKSPNTWQNSAESAKIIREHDYKKIGILTSGWHMDRTRMFQDDQKLEEEGRELFNIPAEQIVGRDSPGYQEFIRQLYASPRMQQRIANEQQGVRDFRSGKYNPRPPH